MDDLVLSFGINENDILVDNKSNNIFENIENVLKLLPSDVSYISIITS